MVRSDIRIKLLSKTLTSVFTEAKMADWSGNKLYLFSERRFNLTIRSSGEVLGVEHDGDPDSKLEITSAGACSLVRIRGIESQLYLCFKDDGHLYGEANPNEEATVFEEGFQGSYNSYESKVFPGWYVGIKKSGIAKNGKRTGWGQKAVKFLKRRKDFSS